MIEKIPAFFPRHADKILERLGRNILPLSVLKHLQASKMTELCLMFNELLLPTCFRIIKNYFLKLHLETETV